MDVEEWVQSFIRRPSASFSASTSRVVRRNGPSVPSRSDRSARVDGNTRARHRSRVRLLFVVWMTINDPEDFIHVDVKSNLDYFFLISKKIVSINIILPHDPRSSARALSRAARVFPRSEVIPLYSYATMTIFLDTPEATPDGSREWRARPAPATAGSGEWRPVVARYDPTRPDATRRDPTRPDATRCDSSGRPELCSAR